MQTSRTRLKVYTVSMPLTVEENVVTAIEVASGDNVEITVVQKEKVAQGGWATVYRAEISPGKETIAIKQVKETKLYKVVSFERRVDKSIARWRFCGQ
jgi:protein involved in polysaccharide export with SLBB domain